MPTEHSIEEKIHELRSLVDNLLKVETFSEKLTILNSLPHIQSYLKSSHDIQRFTNHLTPDAEYAIKSVIAIGQGPIIFNVPVGNEKLFFQRLLRLLEQLMEIETFYQHLGGIIGYHLTVLQLIFQQTSKPVSDRTRFIHPEGLHLDVESPEVQQAVRWGIENMKHIAAIYPLGGSGDRLDLKDEKTGNPLPAALLKFLGFTLLEGLIRDLQASEYLAFKLFGKQLVTPIAIMTSVEKSNHSHILNICKACRWFGRSSDSFYFFIQPVVPAITIEGNWSLSAPLTLTLKPCGHGVLWKLAEQQGVFEWLESRGRHRCLIRQINNPIAGTDHSLSALIGIGCHEHKAFGFVSCERLLRTEEGTNVLIETKHATQYEYRLTNIEYTDFAQRGIDEHPSSPGSPFSIYPTNTNILFADIPSIREIIKMCPIPGQLVNMKSKVPYIDSKGQLTSILGGRLESTMQNIADYIVDTFPHKLTKEESKDALRTFILYNKRSKTISTTKKSYKPGESAYSTPEQAYYDLVSNHYELLQLCQFDLPPWSKFEEYLQQGPSIVMLFHPALGPLYSIISQKIRRGQLTKHSELQLEIAEIDMEDLSLDGSLLIEAIPPLGSYDPTGILKYGGEGRCSIQRVEIRNKGIHKKTKQSYWKNDLHRDEEVRIILHEDSEFHASDITLEGSHYFEVPAHHRLILRAISQGEWEEELTPIKKPTWYWDYSFDKENRVKLRKVKIRQRK